MARKRYVSTDISIDTRVRKLAERSEFAALLYTWMIPHATDDATITADPDELLMQVVPGFRWREAFDVANAIDAMIELGLVRRADGRLTFPEKAFYHYQSYIGDGRRTSPQPEPPEQPHINGSAQQRTTAKTAAQQRDAVESAQNRASSSLSSSFKSSLSGDTPPATQAPPKGGARRRRVTEVDAEFRDELEERYWEALGSREAARDVMSDALNHAAATKHGDQRAYLRNWVRSEAEKATARRRQPMSKMAAARAARPADDGPFEARAPCAKCGARESGKDSDLCVLCQMREAQVAKGMVVEVSPGVYTAA